MPEAALSLVPQSPTPMSADQVETREQTDGPQRPERVDAPPQVVRYYTLLKNYGEQPKEAKDGYLRRAMKAREAWAGNWPDGWKKPAKSPSAFRTHAREIKKGDVKALRRQQRADKGVSKAGLDEQLAAIWTLLIGSPSKSPLVGPQQYFITRKNGEWIIVERDTGGVVEVEKVAGRLHFMTRADAVRELKLMCPEARDIPRSAFDRVARKMNVSLRMTTKERRNAEAWIGFPEPTLGWWAVDSSELDMWVWDRVLDPYRPWVTVCIDQLSAMPMAIIFTRDAPSNLVTRSLLLQAMYPKSKVWRAQGFPKGIKSDFGFRTHWMDQLADTAKAEIGVELKLQDTTAPETPWANGHAEQLISMVQHSLVKRFTARQFPAAYWGDKPENRPEWFRNHTGEVVVDRKDEQWLLGLPYPEQLDDYRTEWVEELIARDTDGEDSISRELRDRLGMSRGKFWEAKAALEPETVRTLPRDLAEAWLMERDEATVRKGGMFKALGETYRHPELVELARGDGKIGIRYDLADISTVQCFTVRGDFICEAVRSWQIRGSESKAAWKKHTAEMREVTKRQREVVEEAARLGDGTDRTDGTDEGRAQLQEVPQVPFVPQEIEVPEEQGEWIIGPDGTRMFMPAEAVNA